MGVTTPYFPRESTVGQPQADGFAIERRVTIPSSLRRFSTTAVFYVVTLAVPARRNLDDPAALKGEKKLFADAGCAACHVPTLHTGPHEVSDLSNQVIHPYTDLLLHDMGDELADHRPDYEADGREWRTPPLWGIGLTATVNGVPRLPPRRPRRHPDGGGHVPRRGSGKFEGGGERDERGGPRGR